ncbi:hypothetical protein [Cryptosporangium arvum]|uniref:hypothetical protein n=1 Tax=Cryptosporangium arvum TaxID=80871 RepID=UPI0004B76669|nr:hypothetical protein [Cryptosporangium arvum]
MSGVLHAKQSGLLRSDYEISLDDQPLAHWDAKNWRAGGSFTLDDRTYEVRSDVLATRFELIDPTGASVAIADRVGRKHWSVEADGRVHTFERHSAWRLEERLVADGTPVGSVRRSNLWSDEATAELPSLPLPLQVFVLFVVLSGWDILASAAG